MGGDHVGDLGELHLDPEVAVHDDLAQFGDQAGVVLRGEEGGIDAEDLGDPQQHGHRQRADVVFDLVEVAGGDFEHLCERRLTVAAFTA